MSRANSGVGESNLVNAFFRLKNGSTKGSLGRVHIVDDEMDVERKMRVQGVARLLVLGVAMQKDNSAQLRFLFPWVDALNTPFSFTRRNALQLAYGPSNLQNCRCQVDVRF